MPVVRRSSQLSFSILAILDAEVPYASVCFKDASGTTPPAIIYETIKEARRRLPEGTHIRLCRQPFPLVHLRCALARLPSSFDDL